MFLFINKQHLTWLSERFVELGQSMHSPTPMNLSRAQRNHARMPEISTLFGGIRLKSLGPRIYSVSEFYSICSEENFQSGRGTGGISEHRCFWSTINSEAG